MNIKTRNIVLNSYSATPIVTSDSMLVVGGTEVCNYRKIVPNSVRKIVAAAVTPAVWTITPTNISTAGTTYGLQVTQYFPNAEGAEANPRTRLLTVDIPTGGLTATQLCDAFKNQWLPPSGGGYFDVTTNATGNATLVITASSTNPIVIVEFVDMGAGAAGNVVQTTAGKYATGTAAFVEAQGADSADVTGTAYTGYYLTYVSDTGFSNTDVVTQQESLWIWLNEADSDYAAAITATDNIFSGLNTAGLAANPESLAV